MKQKIAGDIDSTYGAQSHSFETLKTWHSEHTSVSRLLLSSQVLFPLFATVLLLYYLIYLFELEPNKLRIKLNGHIKAKSKEIMREAKATIWITVTVCVVFNFGTLSADSAALITSSTKFNFLPHEINNYYNDEKEEFSYIVDVPIMMITFDILTLFSCIAIPVIIVLITKKPIDSKGTVTYNISILVYTILSPITCIFTHAYHIIFAFINNPYHATSVLLCYLMTLFILVVIYNKIYYFLSDHEILDQCIGPICVLYLYALASLVIAVPIGLTVAVLLILPINNALDQASNQIYSIYQASVAVFAALVTWKLFSGDTNSVFAVLIKAKDNHDNITDVSWGNMSDKEKEIHLGVKFLNHFGINTDDSPNTGTYRLYSSAPSGLNLTRIPVTQDLVQNLRMNNQLKKRLSNKLKDV